MDAGSRAPSQLDPAARLLAPERYDDGWRRDQVALGVLPPRYADPWARRFEELVRPSLTLGASVLDVGSGRLPALAPGAREDLTYVGLDVSRAELELAPERPYDEVVVGSITEPHPELEGRFDLVLSYQVFEHVSPIDAALGNIGRYLRPGGTLVALFSGRYSAMALLNRAMPHRWAQRLNHRLLGRAPDTVFEVDYDRCYASAFRDALEGWSEVEIEPRWMAAAYFSFSRPVLRAYLALENRLERGGWEDLATHYFVRAVR